MRVVNEHEFLSFVGIMFLLINLVTLSIFSGAFVFIQLINLCDFIYRKLGL